MKIYKAQTPNPHDGWSLISQINSDGIDWHIYKKSQSHTDDWKSYKIMAPDGAPNKAAYWLVRNNKTGQIGFTRDMAVMRENRPDLHSKVEAVLIRE